MDSLSREIYCENYYFRQSHNEFYNHYLIQFENIKQCVYCGENVTHKRFFECSNLECMDLCCFSCFIDYGHLNGSHYCTSVCEWNSEDDNTESDDDDLENVCSTCGKIDEQLNHCSFSECQSKFCDACLYSTTNLKEFSDAAPVQFCSLYCLKKYKF